jgi:hypothetical protein
MSHVMYRERVRRVLDVDGRGLWVESDSGGRWFVRATECTIVGEGARDGTPLSPTTIAAEPAFPSPGSLPARGVPAGVPGNLSPTLFDLIDTPVARLTDPETAHEAARVAARHTKADTELVLQAHHRAGELGLTGSELEAATGRPYASIGPRRPGLVEAGLIAKAVGQRRPNARGNSEQVYVCTPLGHQLAQKASAA